VSPPQKQPTIRRDRRDFRLNNVGTPAAATPGMAGANRFQDLVCYQLARELRKNVNALIRIPPLARDFELCDQLKRAARSATAIIAEGFPCPSHAEFARFLDIAARSLCEIEDRLLDARDGELLTEEQAAPAFNLVKRTSVAVRRMAASLRGTSRPPQ
jgi:four helix bundle protein